MIEGIESKKAVVASSVGALNGALDRDLILKGGRIYYKLISTKCYEQALKYDIEIMKKEPIKVYSECLP